MLETKIYSKRKELKPYGVHCRDKLSDFDIELLLIECFWFCVSFAPEPASSICSRELCVSDSVCLCEYSLLRIFQPRRDESISAFFCLYINSLCFIISWFGWLLWFSFRRFFFLLHFFSSSSLRLLMTSRYKCV